MLENAEMGFEVAMRKFFGDKAQFIAGFAFSVRQRNRWLRKVSKRLRKEILELDTDSAHKERLLINIESFEKGIPRKKGEGWYLTFHLLKLVALMLGVFDVSGSRKRTAFYAREPITYYQETTGDIGTLARSKDSGNILALRRISVGHLSDNNVPIEKIALVMNMSVAALKKEMKV